MTVAPVSLGGGLSRAEVVFPVVVDGVLVFR
jgi:hypothetical protein